MAYKDGDVVYYDNGVIRGLGRVVGIALSELPFCGAHYILEDLSGNIPNETYRYGYFICMEIQMKSEG